jgi:hypothetical protein
MIKTVRVWTAFKRLTKCGEFDQLSDLELLKK